MKTNQTALPSLFVPHGAPTFALRPGEAGAALVAIASSLPRPRAIVVISAHWETTEPTVGFAEQLETIHDFSGFPEALYDIRYPAKGSREASSEVLDALLDAGFKAQPDPKRGLDHGAWLPLRLIFPDADVPVLPLSIQSRQGPEHHYRLGQALAPLTSQGVLILASGNLTHNLSDYHRASMSGGQSPAYVRSFADWMWSRLQAHDLPALLDYRQQAPDAARAHPRDEHLMPLYVAFGAAGKKPTTNRLYAGIDDYVLAMDAYAFQPA